MSRRILLHVGSPKTGTTFLQQIIWSQRDLARDQGLLLPSKSFADHYLASLDVRGLSHRREHPSRAVGMWRRMAEEAASWPGDALISHELFAAADDDQCKRAIEALGSDAEVHVVVTARDLARQIPAEWQEHLKHRAVEPFSSFVQDIRDDTSGASWFWRVQDYAGVVSRWGASLPMSQVHVVTVPEFGADPTLLWGRFARLVGLDPDTFELTGSRSNTSLNIEQAELLRRVNAALGERLPLPGPYPAVVKNVLAHRVLADRAGHALTLTGDDRAFAVERSRDLAVALAALGCDVIGDLRELIPAAGEVPVQDMHEPRPPSDEDLLAESVAAVVGLLDEHSTRLSELARERTDRRPARRALEDAQRQLAVVTADRDGLVHDMQRRPLRHLVIGLSHRWPWLMSLRKQYWRGMKALRRRVRRRGD